MSKEDQIEYPGAEGFWRQSPELIPLQEDLGRLWQGLEESPSFPETEVTSRGEGILLLSEQEIPSMRVTIFTN